jgi:lysophospholipase L1-like esterase
MNHARNFLRLIVVITAFGLIAASAQTPAPAAPVGPQAGQKVAFLGDSITQFGTGAGGYVTLVGQAMDKAGRKIVVIPAGVSGNTSKDMLARLQVSVIDKKPDWMTLSCGVNDVWHGAKGCTLDEYKKNITSIVDQATAAGIKVVILTATMIQEEPNNDLNKQLIPYNDFLRGLAKERHFPLADLNADMQAELASEKAELPGLKGSILTVDGVHMNGLGNEMMAAGVLKAFGIDDAQLAQTKAAWMEMPNVAPVTAKTDLTVNQYRALLKAASDEKSSVDELVSHDLEKAEKQRFESAPAAKP